jgi:gliding motility-associated-like protein
MLRLQNESSYRSLLFATTDEAQQALHPKLTITFVGQLASEPPACDHADTIIITHTTNEYGYLLPNVFTPNGDGINDSFNVLVADTALRQLDLEIYDRWGRQVYKGPAPWDGKGPDGKACSDGVYYYYAMGRFFADSYAPRKGCFQLLR